MVQPTMLFFPKSCSCDFSSCLIAGRDVQYSQMTVRFHICQTNIAAKQENNPIHMRWNHDRPNFKRSKTFCDFPWFRDSGNPPGPGDFPEPDEIEHFEEWYRREAKRDYKELNNIQGDDLPDEDFFVDTGSFEVPSNLGNGSDVISGRDASNPTPEENKPKKFSKGLASESWDRK